MKNKINLEELAYNQKERRMPSSLLNTFKLDGVRLLIELKRNNLNTG